MSAPRCQPGDLAVVVRSKTPGLLGRFVIIDRPARNGDMLYPRVELEIGPGDPHGWWIRPVRAGDKLPWVTPWGEQVLLDERVYLDDCLRPIRPDEGEDEMLGIAGKPPRRRAVMNGPVIGDGREPNMPVIIDAEEHA